MAKQTIKLSPIGIRPFVEIGFMPRILASKRQTLMRWDAYTTPPRDYGLWTELIDHTSEYYELDQEFYANLSL